MGLKPGKMYYAGTSQHPVSIEGLVWEVFSLLDWKVVGHKEAGTILLSPKKRKMWHFLVLETANPTPVYCAVQVTIQMD